VLTANDELGALALWVQLIQLLHNTSAGGQWNNLGCEELDKNPAPCVLNKDACVMLCQDETSKDPPRHACQLQHKRMPVGCQSRN